MSVRVRGLAMVGLLLVAAAPGVRAADDAGTQSLFAAGAGVRALAMGGAFVAAGADASALNWNPAGLGFVERTELQGAQSSGLPLGFSEGYAAFVLPNWRLGSFGVAAHTFGVGGIERRDDRNVLLEDGLTDHELEMAFGYGRALGRIASFGGAMKLRRQAIAGRTGGGMGVDLGAIVRPGLALGRSAAWADRFTFGLALRNALRPGVRLDVENVADPSVTSAGFAYEFPVGVIGAMVAETDFEFVPGRGMQPHLGAELRPRPGMALRGGILDGGLTAGAGLRWHDLTVDYAYRDGSLDATHRVGLTVNFGATVTDHRLAAQRLEDEAVQRRVAEEFKLRQDEHVRELRVEAEAALTAGDADRALESIGRWSTLAPGDSLAGQWTLRALLLRAFALEQSGDLGGAELAYQMALGTAPADTAAAAGRDRCRLVREQHAQQSEALRGAFARAMDALAADDLLTARNGFREILALNPNDADAGAMLRRTQGMIDSQLARRLEQATRSLATGALRDAAIALDDIRRMDPRANGLDAALAALARARAAADAPKSVRTVTSVAGVTPVPAPRATMDDRQAEDLYRRGLDSYRASRAEDAMRFWELVWSARGNYRGVAELLKREYLARGMDAYATGRLEEAVAQWSRVLKIDPADLRAQGYMSRAQQQLTRSHEILGEVQP